AAMGGLAFSCKFTTVLVPPILTIVWFISRWREGECRPLWLTRRILFAMAGFASLMLISNAAVTGFARLPLSTERGHHPSIEKWFGTRASDLVATVYETPVPEDWVGFATQTIHQASGGPSYLFGERRMKGWWYYYFVAIAVKVPLAFWLLAGTRI